MNSIHGENYGIYRQRSITGQWLVWERWHDQQLNVRSYYGDNARNESWTDYAERVASRGPRQSELLSAETPAPICAGVKENRAEL